MRVSFKTLRQLLACAALLFVFGFALYGERVTAAECHYFTGGCGSWELEDTYQTVGSAAECTAICSGRTRCEFSGRSRWPWGCNYMY